MLAAELSARLGLLAASDSARLRRLIARAGLPVAPPRLEEARWLELMALDKKSAGGRPRFVVLERLGSAALKSGVDERLVREVLGSSAAAAR